MIFVDANYFLRYLVEPISEEGRARHGVATVLFDLVERGEEEITTSEAVLAEVAFILSAKRHYQFPADEVAARLKPILLQEGFKLSTKRFCLRALDLWVSMPRLGFVDALGVAYAEMQAWNLATFDTDVDRVHGIMRWQPPADRNGLQSSVN